MHEFDEIFGGDVVVKGGLSVELGMFNYIFRGGSSLGIALLLLLLYHIFDGLRKW